MMAAQLRYKECNPVNRNVAFPALFALFGADDQSSVPMLLRQGMDAMEPALARGPEISPAEVENILAMSMEGLVQFEECAAAAFVAVALYCQRAQVPVRVREDIESLLELIMSKLEEKY